MNDKRPNFCGVPIATVPVLQKHTWLLSSIRVPVATMVDNVSLLPRAAEWTERHARLTLVLLVLFEMLFGLVYSIHLGSELRYWDEREYFQLAQGLVERGELGLAGDRAFRPPLYAFVLAPLLAVGAPVLVMRLLNFVFLGISMVLLYEVVSSFARRWVGLLAAAWVLLYPVLLYTAGTLYPQTLAGMLLLWFVWFLLCRDRTVRSGACAGLVFGALMLTVPSFAPLLAIALFWLGWKERHVAAPYAGAVAIAALTPLFIWGIRNQVVLGQWVFVSSNSGLNFLLGNSENATPGSGTNADISEYIALAKNLGEVERDRFYRWRAFEWILTNPGAAIELYAGKLLHYFATTEQLATAGEGSRLKSLVMGVTYLPLLAGLGVRCLLWRKKSLSPAEILLLLLYLANGIFAALFFTRIRFRLPVDLLAIALWASVVWVVVRSRFEVRTPSMVSESA